MTEFKTALYQLGKVTVEDQVIYWLCSNEDAIRRALLIADRLMQEPSQDACLAGVNRSFELSNMEHNDNIHETREVFKAMRDQLIREIEE